MSTKAWKYFRDSIEVIKVSEGADAAWYALEAKNLNSTMPDLVEWVRSSLRLEEPVVKPAPKPEPVAETPKEIEPDAPKPPKSKPAPEKKKPTKKPK